MSNNERYPGVTADGYIRFVNDLGPEDGPTEFSFGPDLVPRGKERALPEAGGKYRGTTPRYGRPSARDYDAPGHPGERVR
jgi:hypothetical protein